MSETPRETRVLNAVVSLVDSLLDDFDVVDLLTGLTKRCAELLDIEAAGEWFARILFSLFSTPSSTLDMDNPDVAAEFVRAHVVRGFASERPRPRRAQ